MKELRTASKEHVPRVVGGIEEEPERIRGWWNVPNRHMRRENRL